MATMTFDAVDFAAFLALLPCSWKGVPLRHALVVRPHSFACRAFEKLARSHGTAIVHAEGEDVRQSDARRAKFTYAKIMRACEDLTAGYKPAHVSALANCTRSWSKHVDVFCYFISAAKVGNPAATQALGSYLAKSR